MRATIIAAVLTAAACSFPLWAQETAPALPGKGSTADHTKFEVLKQSFASGPDVTKACLTCHTEASDQVMHTLHWTWDYSNPATGQTLGKKNVINAFCGNVTSNETRCTSCHVGYGWTDVRAEPPADPTRVDCLVCHAAPGTYEKVDNLAGLPAVEPLPEGARTITGKLAGTAEPLQGRDVGRTAAARKLRPVPFLRRRRRQREAR